MVFPSYEDVQKVRQKLKETAYEHWLHDDFLTWKWWLLLALSILPWVLWWKIADQQRRVEILLYGVLIGIFAILLDNIGTELLWWGYPDKLFQMVPPLIPADLTLVPITFMLVYQYFNHSFKLFLIANSIVGLITAYVVEPIFVWLDYYQLNKWKPIYSFLFYIISPTLARWILLKVKAKA